MWARAVTFATLPLAVAIIATYLFVSSRPAQEPQVRIGESVIRVELATSSAARALGLGGREGLAPDTGMLFVFPRDGMPAFWMKDMRFSIDMLWLDAAGKIVTIREGISPATYPASFAPTGLSRYVLELPAGYAAAHSFSVGQSAELPLVRQTE